MIWLQGPTHTSWAGLTLVLVVLAQDIGCCSSKKTVVPDKTDIPADTVSKRDVYQSTLPADLVELTRILTEVVGDEGIADNIDPRYDVWGNESLYDLEREKRFAGALTSVAAPLYTTFASSILKPMLNQLIFRPGKQSYKTTSCQNSCQGPFLPQI